MFPEARRQAAANLHIISKVFFALLRFVLASAAARARAARSPRRLPDIGHKAIANALCILSISLKLFHEHPFLQYGADGDHDDEDG
jgi:hypothetical protein